MDELNVEYVTFRGTDYPVRNVNVPDFGVRRVASEDLEGVLFDGEGYVSKTAQAIDESIFFFVPEYVMDYPDDDLEKYVAENVF